MLKVLITIDTETHPIAGNWKEDRLAADMKRDVYGQIDGHAVGLEYQLSTLSKYGLKASFMVESLFAAVPEVGTQQASRVSARSQPHAVGCAGRGPFSGCCRARWPRAWPCGWCCRACSRCRGLPRRR